VAAVLGADFASWASGAYLSAGAVPPPSAGEEAKQPMRPGAAARPAGGSTARPAAPPTPAHTAPTPILNAFQMFFLIARAFLFLCSCLPASGCVERAANGTACAEYPHTDELSALLQHSQSVRAVPRNSPQDQHSGVSSGGHTGLAVAARLGAIGLSALLILALVIAASQLWKSCSGDAASTRIIPPVTPPKSSPWEQFQGTCLVIGGTMIFGAVAVVVKNNQLPVLVATECRFLVNWVVSVCFMAACKTSRGLLWFGPPELRGWLVLKCVVHFLFTTAWWAAIQAAPLGDAIAIIYCCPVLTALMASGLLQEALPRTFALQALLALVGTVLIADPPFLHKLLEHLANSGVQSDPPAPTDYKLLVLALFFCTLIPIVTRKCVDCSWIEVEHVHACLASAILNPLLLAGQCVLTGALPELPVVAPTEIALIVTGSLGCFVGIAMETKGYQLAEAGKAGMFRYIEVPWGYVLQHFFTSTPLKSSAILGATSILASCALQVFESVYF